MKPVALPMSLDSLEPIGRFVQEAAAWAGLDQRSAYWLNLAVDEIATNAIVYNDRPDQDQLSLRLSANMDEESLTICLEDCGPAYNPQLAPPPQDLNKPPAERRPGGLGIYLARYGADNYFYERKANWNRNIFVMRRR